MPCVCDADFHATSHHRDRACTDAQGDVPECPRLARQAESKGMEEEHQKRVKALVFIKAWNNSIRSSSPLPGLRFYCQPKLAQRTRPAFSWPLASGVADHGQEIDSAVNFLQRSEDIQMNYEHIPGLNHACWNAYKAALKGAQLYRQALLAVMHYICRHGPWHTAERFKIIRDFARYLFLIARPNDFDWFQERLPKFLRDFRLEHRAHEPDIADKVWEIIKTERRWEVRKESAPFLTVAQKIYNCFWVGAGDSKYCGCE